ncbi:methyltransferase [Peptococcaceae bacterium SCADC1_2_3]|jgi:SAM-dependent methyltransferase|nr:methyltransferase [Peptococcaceae bacterium SCADC1_2_3]KFI38023.1 methyltransferase [Peptococcaceae bacterium SCADC1_2_3]HBQ28331.1 methyltransferase domain-containing protein [Desulfotomaculum sp.]HCJ79810.1 methyltransferase domain-containing protein [Desulfotomaculum sp.]
MDKEALQSPFELLLVGGAVEAGIFKALRQRALDVLELAGTLKADRRAVWTVAEALVSLDYLERTEGNKYRLSSRAEEMFYRPDSDNYDGFAFMHSYEVLKSWVKLPQVIQSGRPARGNRTAAERRYFIEAMSRRAKEGAKAIAQFCLTGLPAGAQVLDIGGGPLVHARAFAALGAVVTVLDLPEVVAMAQSSLTSDENIHLVAGDFTAGLSEGPFHLAFLGSVCHIYGEKENRRLFRQADAVLVPGGSIAVVDFVRGRHPFAAVFAVNMLVNTETGGTWTWEEYVAWLTDAGFKDMRLNEVGERQIITAIRK